MPRKNGENSCVSDNRRWVVRETDTNETENEETETVPVAQPSFVSCLSLDSREVPARSEPKLEAAGGWRAETRSQWSLRVVMLQQFR